MNKLIELTGADLKRLREEKGLTARQLSEKIGVSANYIYMCESGRKNISLETIQRICKGLKVDARIIFR